MIWFNPNVLSYVLYNHTTSALATKKPFVFGSPNIPTKTKFKKLSTIHGLMMWVAWSVIGLA